MKEFLVSLNVVSPSLSLSEVSARLGVAPAATSHDKGDARPPHGFWEVTVWKAESRLHSSAPLDHQIEDVLEQVPFSALQQIRASQQVEVSMDLAVLFDTANASIVIPQRTARRIADAGLDLEVSSYPCSMGEEEEEDTDR